jgi:hypothetical protein
MRMTLCVVLACLVGTRGTINGDTVTGVNKPAVAKATD